MANKPYIIIDEPNIKPWARYAVNPIIILFAAMLVPMIWNPPYFGRLWLPFIWLVLNGWLLGSPTVKKELLFAVLGLLLMGGLFYLIHFVYINNIQFEFSFFRYMGVLINAVLFLFIYLIVFLQTGPYEIYEYLKEDRP